MLILFESQRKLFKSEWSLMTNANPTEFSFALRKWKQEDGQLLVTQILQSQRARLVSN